MTAGAGDVVPGPQEGRRGDSGATVDEGAGDTQGRSERLSEYWIAEARYWRRRAERLDRAIRHNSHVMHQATWSDETPPEPPVGSVLGHWTRREDGWHCAADPCANCPAEWFEVWDIGDIRSAQLS